MSHVVLLAWKIHNFFWFLRLECVCLIDILQLPKKYHERLCIFLSIVHVRLRWGIHQIASYMQDGRNLLPSTAVRAHDVNINKEPFPQKPNPIGLRKRKDSRSQGRVRFVDARLWSPTADSVINCLKVLAGSLARTRCVSLRFHAFAQLESLR